jgi:hypothetical protein
MRNLQYLLVIAVLTAAALVTSATDAQDRVVGVAYGNNEMQALNEAYYEAFRSQLESVAGDEASGQIGDRFRRNFERDANAFQRRYFGSDTAERCLPEGTRYVCEIEGRFDAAALRNDLADTLGGTAYTFIASAAEASDARASFVVDRLTGEFAAYNHRVLFGEASRNAIREETANFSLAIYETTFSSFEYDRYLGRSNGSLTVRFRLLDLQSGETLAVEPVVVTATAAGTNISANDAVLVEQLAERGAAEIAAAVNAEVATYSDRADAIAAASALDQLGLATFTIRVVGVNRRDQNDRQFLRFLRDTLSATQGLSGVETDFDASTDSETVITFNGPNDMSPDDMIDRLYAAFDYLEGFYADYFGQGEYEIGY